MNLVLDAGADDMKDDGDMYEILTEPAKFGAVMDVLEKAGIKTQDSEISMVPLTLVPVNEVSVANSVSRFINDLEDYDDVQNVYTNMDISDEVADKMDK
jgi:transcriptional/translational regulatory protein YebC/TACO1